MAEKKSVQLPQPLCIVVKRAMATCRKEADRIPYRSLNIGFSIVGTIFFHLYFLFLIFHMKEKTKSFVFISLKIEIKKVKSNEEKGSEINKDIQF